MTLDLAHLAGLEVPRNGLMSIVGRSRPSSDLRQLWRRIAFSAAIHNTDDHLRNHGLLWDGAGGWRLSPAFAINPNPNVNEATRAWRTAATANGIGTSEQHRFEAAFEELREPMESLSSATPSRPTAPPRDPHGRYAHKRPR